MKINAFADVSLRALMVLAAAPEADLSRPWRPVGSGR